MYAFDFVFANFGIAIAARMPMITITINSSINVKPLRFILSPIGRGRALRLLHPCYAKAMPRPPWHGAVTNGRATPWKDTAGRKTAIFPRFLQGCWQNARISYRADPGASGTGFL